MAEEIPTMDDTAGEEERGDWFCTKCGRRFETAHGLDLHDIRKHQNRKWGTKKSAPVKRWKATASDKRQMKQLFNEGKTRAEIASELGYSYGFIAKTLHSMGKGAYDLPKRTVPKPVPMHRHRLKRKEKGKIRKLFKKGYTRKEIAAKLNIPYATISSYLSRAGFHQRVYAPRGSRHHVNKDPWKIAKLSAQKAMAQSNKTGYKLEEGAPVTVKAIRCPHCGKLMVLEEVS